MKLALLLVGVAACGPFQYRTQLPRPPFCVVDGTPPEGGMVDYGTVYAAGVNGPAAAPRETRLVASDQAGAECVAPPWWVAPD